MDNYSFGYEDDDLNDEINFAKRLFEPEESDSSKDTGKKIDSEPKVKKVHEFVKGHPRTISEKTQKTYQNYMKAIYKKLVASNPMEFELRPVLPSDLVSFLFDIAHTLRPNTFSSYRSALVYWLSQQLQDTEVQNARLALNVDLSHLVFKGVKPGELASRYSTRSQRKRTFSKKDFQKLIAEINARSGHKNLERARSAANLLFWLKAGLATGLRPIEWEKAYWHDKTNGILFVHTAKTKHDASPIDPFGDACDPSSNTRLVKVDKEGMFWVEQHLERVKNHLRKGLTFDKYYNNTRTYLWNLNKAVFNRNVFTLYIMRGQFAANKKGSGMSCSEVAEIMGCSVNVASANYGKRSNAHRNGRHQATLSSQQSENVSQQTHGDISKEGLRYE